MKYRVSEHRRCQGISRRIQAFCAINLQCSETRWERNPVHQVLYNWLTPPVLSVGCPFSTCVGLVLKCIVGNAVRSNGWDSSGWNRLSKNRHCYRQCSSCATRIYPLSLNIWRLRSCNWRSRFFYNGVQALGVRHCPLCPMGSFVFPEHQFPVVNKDISPDCPCI
jgi:hypothetical protein